MSKKIVTLYSDKEKTNELLPRTKTQAITNSSDVNLDTILSNKQDKVSSATDNVASFNSSGQVENSGITKSDVAQVVSEWKTIEEIKNNQEFNYREVPVSYDGTGTITRIQGNTVKFNQLVEEGNFESTSGWAVYNATMTVSNNKATVNTTTDSMQIARHIETPYKQGNKFYLKCGVKCNQARNIRVRVSQGSPFGLQEYIERNLTANVHEVVNGIVSLSSDIVNIRISAISFNSVNGDVFEFDNFYCIDLTQIFGSGNEPSTVEEVEEWLSTHLGLLPYYDYTQGTLIPFSGTGLKTVGKNLFDSTNGELNYWYDAAGNKTITDSSQSSYICEKISVSSNNYTFKANGSNISFLYSKSFVFFDNNNNFVARSHSAGNGQFSITVPDNASYFVVQVSDTFYSGDITSYINDWKIQVETGTQATLYEPYTSNTLSLPISTYFPTGMKDVPDNANGGTIYDEIIPSRADTRIGSVDLGTLNWQYDSSLNYMVTYDIPGVKTVSSDDIALNGKLAIAPIIPASQRVSVSGIRAYVFSNSTSLYIRGSSYTNAADFKTAMSGQYFYFELATPTSQDISLDLTYPIWIGGTEQILPVNGSTPTTSNIICDIDYRNEAKVRQDNTDKISDIVDDIDTINSNISNVVNTGDSDTPVENGTDKFTTGGAYDLKSLIDSKQDIYYGTTMPSSSMGNDGDVFILYS